MSEYKHTGEALENAPEITFPKEMGFQSYELLAGNAETRKYQKDSFMSGKVRNPTFDYPRLDEHELQRSIRNLESVFDVSEKYNDDTLSEVIWNSASYRMAEMYWLLEAKRVNELSLQPESEEFILAAQRYQAANEQLYGRPEKDITEAVYGEIIAQANVKPLHPALQTIYNELIDGTTVKIRDEDIVVKGIGDHYKTRLPQDVKVKLTELREVLREQFDAMFAITNDYWHSEIEGRDEESRSFDVQDMKAVFEKVRDFYDPDNIAGIDAVIDPNSSQLAWDTPTMTVRIGQSRKPIGNPQEMAAKILHEYGVHGLRAMNGKKSGLPTLDTGMYSDAGEGERSDYLTFEEGFASLCEMAIDDGFSKWKPMHVNHYLSIASAYEGNDFRQTFERAWRARVVMDASDDKELTDAMVTKAKTQAYLSCTRVFRGTPTVVTNKPTMTFNKDLAYLHGKLDGLRYLEENGFGEQSILRLFAGKFDPNNQVQNKLVQQYVGL
jgi:hypothetical protein